MKLVERYKAYTGSVLLVSLGEYNTIDMFELAVNMEFYDDVTLMYI